MMWGCFDVMFTRKEYYLRVGFLDRLASPAQPAAVVALCHGRRWSPFDMDAIVPVQAGGGGLSYVNPCHLIWMSVLPALAQAISASTHDSATIEYIIATLTFKTRFCAPVCFFLALRLESVGWL